MSGMAFNVSDNGTSYTTLASGVAAVLIDNGNQHRSGIIVYNAGAADAFVKLTPYSSPAPLGSAVNSAPSYRIPSGHTLTLDCQAATNVYACSVAPGVVLIASETTS